MSIRHYREYECQECDCWFGVHDCWSEDSLTCPLCQGKVKQLKEESEEAS